MKQIKNLILDMDGVLWRGDTPMPGLAAFFDTLRELEMGFVLATNNASKTAVQYTEKLARFGVVMPPEAILTSALATADYASHHHPPGSVAYVAGGLGLQQAVRDKGYPLLTPDEVWAGATAAFIAVGFHPEITYRELAAGALLVQRGAQFIGSNPDTTFPSEIGLLPGAGSLIAFVATATGVTPTIIGKPGPIMFQEAMLRLGGNLENTAMVGDRLGTDIAGGKAAGMHTILVLSGITQPEELETSDLQPDYVLPDIAALTKWLRQEKG
ncbi:MAG: HAD-IIA family hydrolase [Anaerolineales bacterium]|nr:HAD-IIA family hydrolase [Anaerolineales bacterium]